MADSLRRRIAAVLAVTFILCLIPTAGLHHVAAESGTGDDNIGSSVNDKGDSASDDVVWPAGPEIQGDGAIVIDADSGSILYEKDIYGKYYPASTTKILTTLVALENSTMDEVVTVSYAADNYVSKTSSRMGLVEGEQLTMEQALYGIMLESANEATYAVGEHVGHSIAGFIKMMNRKAKKLGCSNSHFANSHGLHDEDHYTCPYDMSLIAKAAYQNEEFMKITGTATYAMPETNKNKAKLLTNHHWFLNGTMKYDYCIGGKTGATTQAGYALVTYARKHGKTLISVVMHSPTWETVYADTKLLLDYCFDNYSIYRMEDVGGEEAQGDLPSLFGEIEMFTVDSEERISVTGDGSLIMPKGIDMTKLTKSVRLDNGIELEHGDNVIGNIEYNYGQKLVGAADIVYYNDEFPITEKVFEERWPEYMIPVDVAFENVNPSLLRQPTTKEQEELQQEKNENTAYVIGGIIGAMVFVVGGLIIVIKRR